MARDSEGSPCFDRSEKVALSLRQEDGRILQNNPIVSMKIADKSIMLCFINFGVEWSKAQAVVTERLLPILTAPSAHRIRGIGNIRDRVREWRTAGLHVTIATNDNRAGPLAELHLLGIHDVVDMIVCADNDGLASKPSPVGLWRIAQTLGVAPSRLAMVGDAGRKVGGRWPGERPGNR